jgi:hypothetical protein
MDTFISAVERPATHDEASEKEGGNEPYAAIRLELLIRDPDLIGELEAFPEGRRRDEFALGALKIGVLAISQAQGRIDAEIVRNEGDHLIASLAAQLTTHQGQITAQLASTLREYFDPASGRFNERVERLIRQDGELEQLLRNRMEASVASLKAALDPYLGEGSRLMELLSPGESNALAQTIKVSVDQLIAAQNSRLLAEFSLDNKSGVLARLVAEVSTQNGALMAALQGSVQNVVREFSLDQRDSALSRLVRRVELAQSQISAEFTLDSEESALSRMKRDLTGVIDNLRRDSAAFQERVVTALEAMKARKQQSLASTAHGRDFEKAAYEFLEQASQDAGDIPERTGDRTGYIRHCKKGDCVITLGPDAEAAGARIVCEIKEDKAYDLASSLTEIQQARENREAPVGLFIHSKRTAPAGLRPLARYGNDVVVVWDAEDTAYDVFLTAGIMVCKALALRKDTMSEALAADFAALDKAIREIERQASFLDEIETSSNTIKSGAAKILKRVDAMRSALEKQIAMLDQQSRALRVLAGDDIAR